MLGQCAGLQPSYALNEVVATGTIDSSSFVGTTTAALLTSGNYRIDVSGAYSSLHNVADAEYTSDDDWATSQQGYDDGQYVLGEGFGDVQVNGQFVDWGAYSPQHTYSLTTALDAGTVNLAVFDGDAAKEAGWYADNSGSLTYTITYVGP